MKNAKSLVLPLLLLTSFMVSVEACEHDTVKACNEAGVCFNDSWVPGPRARFICHQIYRDGSTTLSVEKRIHRILRDPKNASITVNEIFYKLDCRLSKDEEKRVDFLTAAIRENRADTFKKLISIDSFHRAYDRNQTEIRGPLITSVLIQALNDAKANYIKSQATTPKNETLADRSIKFGKLIEEELLIRGEVLTKVNEDGGYDSRFSAAFLEDTRKRLAGLLDTKKETNVVDKKKNIYFFLALESDASTEAPKEKIEKFLPKLVKVIKAKKEAHASRSEGTKRVASKADNS